MNPIRNRVSHSTTTAPKRLLFSLVSIGLFFSLIEIALHLSGFEYQRTERFVESSMDVEPHWLTRALVRDPTMPWSWLPGPGLTATQPMDHGFTYNRHGFIGPEVRKTKSPDTMRVICMGDSCTLGWNSPEGETYPDHLRRLLQAMSPGMFQVINAGVSGYTSYQGLHDFRNRIASWSPDILVVSYNWNDHGDAPDQAGLSIGNISGERRQYPDKDQPSGTLISSGKIPLGRIRIMQFFTWMHDAVIGSLNAGISSPAHDSAQTSPPARQPGTGLRRVSPEDFRSNLTEFAHLAKSLNFKLVFLTQAANPVQHRDAEPWKTYYRFQDDYNDIMRETAFRTGTPLVDAAGCDWWMETMFYDHVHTQPEGNRRIAGLVQKKILELLIVPT